MEHEGDNYTNHDWCIWYSHWRIIKGTGELGDRRTNGDHPNNNIIENSQNTEKSPGYLRRLAVTQTPVKDHQLTLMWKAFNLRDNVDRLYVPRKGGGRGLSSIEDSVDTSIQWLEDSIEKHEQGLIMAIRNNTDNTIDNRMTITRKQKWEGKQLYGRFKLLINNISHDKTWMWLRKGNFKRETESLLMVAQNCTIRTNHIKARIDKMQ